MDISNSTQTGSVTPSVAKVTGGVSGKSKVAPQGNSLPVQVQVSVPSDNTQAKGSAPTLDIKELRNLVGQANEALQARSSDLKFSVDESTNINVVRIEDSETGEIIRQFPSEAMLSIARALEEMKQGSMFKEKA